MNSEYILNCADTDELAIAYQVWGLSDNELLYVPRMVYHLELVLEDSAY